MKHHGPRNSYEGLWCGLWTVEGVVRIGEQCRAKPVCTLNSRDKGTAIINVHGVKEGNAFGLGCILGLRRLVFK